MIIKFQVILIVKMFFLFHVDNSGGRRTKFDMGNFVRLFGWREKTDFIKRNTLDPGLYLEIWRSRDTRKKVCFTYGLRVPPLLLTSICPQYNVRTVLDEISFLLFCS